MSEFVEYEAHGWRLCAIERGKKAPTYAGWNTSAMPAESIEALEQGAGLLHALSGTCVLDLDNLEAARPWLAERGIDLDALRAEPASVHPSSGRPNRDKLLYRLAKPLRTIKPTGSGLELRCATASGSSVQDVLPPTIHPDTKKPYFWKYGDDLVGDWRSPPNIPAALYNLWRELVAETPVTEIVNEVVQDQPIDLVRRALYSYITSRKKDVSNYDDWIEIGMRLHKQTQGAADGMALWDEWSKTDTSTRKDGGPRYVPQAIRDHWISFGKTTGRTVGMDAAIRELPAEADEFPDESQVAEAATEETTEVMMQATAREKRKAAGEWLEKRLVYVARSERYFDTERHVIYNTESAIEHMFTWRMPKGKGGGKMNPVKMLKESGSKTIVDGLGFHPGEGTIYSEFGDTYANKYRNRLPEPLEPTAEELERIVWLFDRIDDVPYREWLIQFYGFVIQNPGVKVKSAPLIWSDTQGNGKTTLVRMIPALLVGQQYSKEVNSGILNSDFNDVLLDAWHINLTEFRAGSRGEREAISKKVENWIADDVTPIHPKGSAGYSIPNHFFVTASSNAEDAASITNQDRKWAIHEMHAPQMTEDEQNWLYAYLTSRRAAATLRHYFLHVDITGFSPNARAPETAAKREMAAASASSDMEALMFAWEERSGPFVRDVVLTQEVMQYVHKHSPARPSAHRISKVLTRPPFNARAIHFRVGPSTYRALVLFNQPKWCGSPGVRVLDHIQGNDVVIDDVDPLLT